MASPLHAAALALIALVFWTALGYPLTRRFLDRSTALAFAPLAGWAVHDVVAVPLFYVVPWSAPAIAIVALVLVAAAWRFVRPALCLRDDTPGVPPLAWLVAAVIAAICAAAVVPKFAGDAVYLSSPVFDHSKAAMIDSLVRSGLPPANPFITHDGNGGRLAYYYLWHFSAAQLARLFGTSGWEADIAMTFFSALTSLAALMALAVRFAGRAAAAGWVLLVAFAASARPLLVALLGQRFGHWIEPPGGFQGWLFQAAWVPQHLISTTCVLLSLLLLADLAATRPRASATRSVDWPRALFLGIVIAAGFESSTWVGGVVFAVCCLFVVPFLLLQSAPGRRIAFVSATLAAALATILLAWPFLSAQLTAASSRQATTPIALSAFSVLGDAWSPAWRRLLNPPAFFVALLPIEFTAVFIAGAVAGWAALRSRATPLGLRTLAVAGIGALGSAWLLVSTLADNNDLGWRAGLLAVVILIVFAAIAVTRWSAARRWLPTGLALLAVAAGLPDAWHQVGSYLAPAPQADGRSFAAAPALWARVRTIADPAERVASNPRALATMTPWPVAIGWALLADRPSCYATWELVQVYSSIPHDRLRAIDAQFIRVFAGRPAPGDVRELATTHDCAVVVVTPDDGAWTVDPFRDSAAYRLVDEVAGRWRIYRRRIAGSANAALADPR